MFTVILSYIVRSKPTQFLKTHLGSKQNNQSNKSKTKNLQIYKYLVTCLVRIIFIITFNRKRTLINMDENRHFTIHFKHNSWPTSLPLKGGRKKRAHLHSVFTLPLPPRHCVVLGPSVTYSPTSSVHQSSALAPSPLLSC